MTTEPAISRDLWSYYSGLTNFRNVRRVKIAAPRCIPRKTVTLVATVSYKTATVSSSRLMTLMKRMASGAESIIWRTELTATRIAQYYSSPPASPFQIITLRGV